MIERSIYIKIRVMVRLPQASDKLNDDYLSGYLFSVVNELDYRIMDTTGVAEILDTEITDFELIPEEN